LKALPADALEDAVLVVAHPDDEILWFGSVIARMKRIIMVFEDCPDDPSVGPARRAALARHPFGDRIVQLQLRETGSVHKMNWEQPQVINGVPETGHGESDSALRNREHRLEEALSPMLGDFKNVFTHNPWGEYGHEEHILVNSVATRLAVDRGCRVWYSNYASNLSQVLMTRFINGFGTPVFSEPVDAEAMESASDCYREAGCWTWYAEYVWFDREYFVEGPLAEIRLHGEGSVFPINFIRVRPRHKRPARPRSPAHRMKRRLRRLLRWRP
jgi:LmbE family N-acetylglucosaminyl deacetylase